MADKVKIKSVLKCEICGSHDLKTYNSRGVSGTRWRRKECQGCGHRFSTYEIREADFNSLLDVKSCKSFLVKIRDLINGIIEQMEDIC